MTLTYENFRQVYRETNRTVGCLAKKSIGLLDTCF